MKAVVCVPGGVEVADIEDPVPAPDEVGLNAIMASRLAGVDRVVGAGRSAGRRAAAAAIGADEVVDTRETRVPVTIAGSCAFDAATYARSVEHIGAGRVPVASLVSDRVGLGATPEALVRLRAPGDLVRALSRPWD